MAQPVLLATVLFLTLYGSVSSELVALGNAIRLSWTFTTTNITFTLEANTTGWAGIGFSRSGGMEGADIVMLVPQNGNVAIQDRYATGMLLPVMDTQQDYRLLSGSVVNGQLRAQFSRLLDTCDPRDAVITNFTTKIIMAIGGLDGSGTPQYHGSSQRSSSSLYLLSGEPARPSDAGIFNIDPVPKNISIANNRETTYWCSLVQLPRLTKKTHVIEIIPMITPGNEDMVHHMLVFMCDAPVNPNVSSFNCFDGSDPGNQNNCTVIVGLWAVGGTTMRFPSNVGLPFDYGNSSKYILIQTHYNNMARVSGRVDASYLRFVATQALRPIDAGILQTGVINGMLIPPNVEQTLVAGYCPGDCLSSLVLPSSGINAFAVGLHSHLLGRRVTLRHFRPAQNLQLPVIADDPSYDFEYQEPVYLESPRVILPGDVLQTVCMMNSSARNVATQGGISTMQEMCLSFIFYYPKITLNLCQTYPAWTFTPNHPTYQLLGKRPASFDWDAGVNNGLAGATWSSELIQTLQKGYTVDGNGFYCRNDLAGYFNVFVPPTLASSLLPVYSAVSQQCQSTVASGYYYVSVPPTLANSSLPVYSAVSQQSQSTVATGSAVTTAANSTGATGAIGGCSTVTFLVLAIFATSAALAF